MEHFLLSDSERIKSISFLNYAVTEPDFLIMGTLIAWNPDSKIKKAQ
mgnify:CR=1 FL=1